MTGRSNKDLVFEPGEQRPDPRTLQKRVTSTNDQGLNGYETLDQASQDEYGMKERRGTFRDVRFPHRY